MSKHVTRGSHGLQAMEKKGHGLLLFEPLLWCPWRSSKSMNQLSGSEIPGLHRWSGSVTQEKSVQQGWCNRPHPPHAGVRNVSNADSKP